jgi:molybdopterin-guanine dinucleotide biosynthesis protein A
VATYDAIIPAGGEIDADFAKVVGTTNKALIHFEGRTTLDRIVDALRESGCIRRIAVIGPPEVHQAIQGRVELLLEPGNSGPDNILKGLDALSETDTPPDKVVVVTSDLPFLTGELVKRFIEMCSEADITLPLISKEDFQARFPDSDSTFIPLKDGTWTAGCMYLLDVKALRRAKPHIDKVFEVRKSTIGMAKLLGLRLVWKFVTKTLAVSDIERKIETMLHCTGKAIKGSPPELAYDIDYLDDYEYAVKHLESKG